MGGWVSPEDGIAPACGKIFGLPKFWRRKIVGCADWINNVRDHPIAPLRAQKRTHFGERTRQIKMRQAQRDERRIPIPLMRILPRRRLSEFARVVQAQNGACVRNQIDRDSCGVNGHSGILICAANRLARWPRPSSESCPHRNGATRRRSARRADRARHSLWRFPRQPASSTICASPAARRRGRARESCWACCAGASVRFSGRIPSKIGWPFFARRQARARRTARSAIRRRHDWSVTVLLARRLAGNSSAACR